MTDNNAIRGCSIPEWQFLEFHAHVRIGSSGRRIASPPAAAPASSSDTACPRALRRRAGRR